jgi:hypothetical protein
MKPEMQFKWASPAHGARWVRHGWRVFASQPFAFLMLTAVFPLLLLLASVPVLGAVTVLALPLVSLGFMLATHQALQGKTPHAGVFVMPLRVTRQRTRALLVLGLWQALALMGVLLVCHWGDGGAFLAVQEAVMTGKPAGDFIQAPHFRLWMWLRLVGFALVSLLFWFAPALVHWGGHGAGKALFFSAVACWRNKWAFAVFGVVWLALSFGAGVLASLLVAVVGEFAQWLLLPLVLSAMAAFYAAHFFSFLDSFALINRPGPGPVVEPPAEPPAPAADEPSDG